MSTKISKLICFAFYIYEGISLNIDVVPNYHVISHVGGSVTINFTASWEKTFQSFIIHSSGFPSVIGFIRNIETCRLAVDAELSNIEVNTECKDGHLEGMLYIANIDNSDNGRQIKFGLFEKINMTKENALDRIVTIYVQDQNVKEDTSKDSITMFSKSSSWMMTTLVFRKPTHSSTANATARPTSINKDTSLIIKLPRGAFYAVIAGVSAAIVITVILCVLKYQRKKRLKRQNMESVELEDFGDLDSNISLSTERELELRRQLFGDAGAYENDCIVKELQAEGPYDDLEPEDAIQNMIDWPYEEVDERIQNSGNIPSLRDQHQDNSSPSDSSEVSSEVREYTNVFVPDGYENCNREELSLDPFRNSDGIYVCPNEVLMDNDSDEGI